MTRRYLLVLLVAAGFGVGCLERKPPTESLPVIEWELTDETPWLGPDRGPVPDRLYDLPQQAEGIGGAVATAHPLATRAGAFALREGGNAVDALIAASFMLSVVNPQSTGIGGGGFAVVVPPDGPPRAFDFRETAPLASRIADYLDENGRAVARRTRNHGLAVGVPGFVRGMAALHRRYGKTKWKYLVLPAAHVAERGFTVDRTMTRSIGKSLGYDGLADEARKVFAPTGEPLAPGTILRPPRQAETLRRIAYEGPDVFYEGPIAEEIATTVRDAGGRMTAADLASYEVRDVEPLIGDFLGRTVVTMPEPSGGGAQLLAMAEFVDQWKIQQIDELGRLNAMAEAMRRSFLLRLAHSTDVSTPSTTLDEAFPAEDRERQAEGFDPRRASSSADLELRPHDAWEAHENTSHVAIVDSNGWAASSTHTVNLHLGSGIMTPTSGIVLNNEMDDFTVTEEASNYFGLAGSETNLIRPGARPVSSMTPTVVLDREGSPTLVIGTPGGTKIPTTVFRAMIGTMVEGLSLAEALALPRFHHQAWPDVVEVEVGDDGDRLAEQLTRLGHPVQRTELWCNTQAIRIVDGVTSAAADPRWEGRVAIVPL